MLSSLGVNGVLIGSLISASVHVGAGGGIYYLMTKKDKSPIVAELDLSMVPLVPSLPNAGGGSGAKEPEAWIAAKKGKKAPTPAVVEKPQTKEEVVKEENQPAPCEGPCAEGPLIGQGWGGGNGQGDGDYVPVSETARKPRWIKNFITSYDYPVLARQEGKDGRVVLTVLLDREGRVRDARLLEGSYDVLNEVALRKVKQAIFTPAYNDEGAPVSCKVTLPIRFELH